MPNGPCIVSSQYFSIWRRACLFYLNKAEGISKNMTTLLLCRKNYENYTKKSIAGQSNMVGYVLLQYSHIISHKIAYQFLLNEVPMNQKLSQIHKSSIQLNLHFIPKATITKLSQLLELVIYYLIFFHSIAFDYNHGNVSQGILMETLECVLLKSYLDQYVLWHCEYIVHTEYDSKWFHCHQCQIRCFFYQCDPFRKFTLKFYKFQLKDHKDNHLT